MKISGIIKYALLILIIMLQFALTVSSSRWNSVTVDEAAHLPSGISYWHFGTFWCYHHNPPLIKLIFAIPALLMQAGTDYSHYWPGVGERPEFHLARDFMYTNQASYHLIFNHARMIVAFWAALGGLLIFRWSEDLFGTKGAFVSLLLWASCPEVLAHGGLATVDVGATVMGIAASYGFARFLDGQTYRNAVVAGILLGLALASKFTFLALLPLFLVAAIWRNFISKQKCFFKIALYITISILIVNNVYMFEGSFERLDSWEFKSSLFKGGRIESTNRFKGTTLAGLRAPLPREFILGFDDQLSDIDGGGYYKFLDGTLKQGDGWWYYYIRYLSVKLPEPTLIIFIISTVILFLNVKNISFFKGFPLIIFFHMLIIISAQTKMNYGRYLIPAFPYIMITSGNIVNLKIKYITNIFLSSLIAVNVVYISRSFPNYLSFFNTSSGGSARGIEHLADSCLDWGQGLIELKSWADSHAAGERLHLGYFGSVDPAILGIDYELAYIDKEVASSNTFYAKMNLSSENLRPGLYAISANYLVGVPFPAFYSRGRQVWLPRNAYKFYSNFLPYKIIGNTIYVYNISERDIINYNENNKK